MVPERPHLRFLTQYALASINRIADRVEQHVSVEWLRQEFCSSCLHRPDCRWYVGVPCDEDDRHVNSIGGDALLQIEAIEVRKLNVKYQATRREDSGTSQEFLCGSECFRPAACALDQQFKPFADQDIVINNEHDRYSAPHARCVRFSRFR